MLLPCPVFIRNGVSSEIHPLDFILTAIFPIMFIVSMVKPQNSAWSFFSMGRIFNCRFLSFSSWSRFCFRKLTGLAESTVLFIFTVAASLNPIFTSFFVSRPLSSRIVLFITPINRGCHLFPLLFRNFSLHKSFF